MTISETPAGPAGLPAIPVRNRRLRPTQRARLIHIGSYVLALLVVVALALKIDWSPLGKTFFNWQLFKAQFPKIVTIATRNTLALTFVSFVLSLALGLLIAVMKLSSLTPFRVFATGYVEIFRGLPLLVTLQIVGFGLPIALGKQIPDLGFVVGAGVVALTLVYGAYMGESIRAGIEAVPKGQMEAARSLGMSRGRSMVSIVIPQAFRIVIPPLTNEFVALIKDTSLVAVLGTTVATKELTKFGKDAAGDAFNSTPLIAAGVMYLVITIPLTRLVNQLEKRNRQSR